MSTHTPSYVPPSFDGVAPGIVEPRIIRMPAADAADTERNDLLAAGVPGYAIEGILAFNRERRAARSASR